MKRTRNVKFTIYDVVIIGLMVAVIVVSNLLDNFIPGLSPLHLIITAVIFSFLGIYRSAIVLTLFAIIFYVTGGISFIVGWEQFVILWISGYFLLGTCLFEKLCVSKKTKKINFVNWFFLWLITQFIFLLVVVIANTYYFPGVSNFGTRIALSFALPGNWLNNLVAAISVLIIVPLVWRPMRKVTKNIVSQGYLKY